MQAWEWILIILVIIIIIAIIIWAIWYFGVRDIGKPAGEQCGANTECAKKTYCNASGTCQSGTGKTQGQTCSTMNECVIGLRCNAGVCSPEEFPGLLSF